MTGVPYEQVPTVVPPQQPPPPPPLPEMSDTERRARERMRGLRVPGQPTAYEQGEGAGRPIIVPASMTQPAQREGPIVLPPDLMLSMLKTAQPEAGDGRMPEGLQLAGYKSSFAAKVAEDALGQFKTPGHIVKSGGDLAEMAKGGLAPKMPTTMDAIMSALPPGLSAIPDFLKEHAEAHDPLLQKLRFMLGIPEADVPTPAPWKPGGAWHQGEGEGKPSGFEDRFGVWPGTGADKLDQTSSKLDQAANQNVNISGAGKIQVDVRAPPRTSAPRWR